MITDHANYAEHIASEINKIDGVYNQVFSDYPPIVKTKYRLKADSQNIESHYFCLTKASL